MAQHDRAARAQRTGPNKRKRPQSSSAADTSLTDLNDLSCQVCKALATRPVESPCCANLFCSLRAVFQQIVAERGHLEQARGPGALVGVVLQREQLVHLLDRKTGRILFHSETLVGVRAKPVEALLQEGAAVSRSTVSLKWWWLVA